MFKALPFYFTLSYIAVFSEASVVDGCLGRPEGQEILGAVNYDIDDWNVSMLKSRMTPMLKVKRIEGCVS